MIFASQEEVLSKGLFVASCVAGAVWSVFPYAYGRVCNRPFTVTIQDLSNTQANTNIAAFPFSSPPQKHELLLERKKWWKGLYMAESPIGVSVCLSCINIRLFSGAVTWCLACTIYIYIYTDGQHKSDQLAGVLDYLHGTNVVYADQSMTDNLSIYVLFAQTALRIDCSIVPLCGAAVSRLIRKGLLLTILWIHFVDWYVSMAYKV